MGFGIVTVGWMTVILSAVGVVLWCESAALNMLANLEDSAVATGLEKVSFPGAGQLADRC